MFDTCTAGKKAMRVFQKMKQRERKREREKERKREINKKTTTDK